MLYDYQNGKPARSLVAHYFDEHNYVHLKPLLSVGQHERIIQLVQAFDAARGLASGVSGQPSVQQCFANLRHEFEGIKKSIFNSPVTAQRKVSKKDYREIELQASPKTVASKSPIVERSSGNETNNALAGLLPTMSAEQYKEIEHLMEGLEDPLPSLVNLLLDNKGKVATGLVALYALLAKANDWPPYNKKPIPQKVSWKVWIKNQIAETGETIMMMSA